MRVLIFRNLENRNPHKYHFSIIYFIFHYLLCIYSNETSTIRTALFSEIRINSKKNRMKQLTSQIDQKLAKD